MMSQPLIRGKLWIVIIAVFTAFAAVSFTACSERDNSYASPDKCSGVVCKNGGTCFLGNCSCNAGYTGPNCETEWVDSYTGSWQITEKIEKSSEDTSVGRVRSFTWQIKKSEDPVYFVVDNMRGVEAYDGMRVRMGRNEYNAFTGLDDFVINPKVFKSGQDGFSVAGGYGHLRASATRMNGIYYTISVRDSIPVYDTISFEGIYAP